jgi:hypothetical protein
MRRVVPLVIFALCSGLPLIGLLGLAIMWFGEVQALVLPGATDVRIDRSSLTHQHITYQLPPNRTLNDLSVQLVQDGWTHDVPGERALRRDQMDNHALMLFWRHSWLGLVPEVVTVRPGAQDQRMADIQLIRCFTIRGWTRCL